MTLVPDEDPPRMFSGVCIGGPLAGQRVESYVNYFRAANYPSNGVFLKPSTAKMSMDNTLTVYEYKHHELKCGQRSFGFWIHYEKTGEDLILALVRTYRAAHGQ